MSRSLLALVLVASLGLVAWPAAAQMHHPMDSGAKRDCDLCAPLLSVDAGALLRSAAVLPASGSDETTPLVRARLEVESFVPHVGLFSTMEFTPADGVTPTLTLGLKLWARPRSSRWNITGGLGLIDYRQGINEPTAGAFVMRGWGQIDVSYHTPLHELTVYGQAGAPSGGVRRATYQIGISHPLAPYKLHLGL